MKEYIMSVIAAGILCSVSEIISPEKWKKYIKLMTGVIISIIMISPIKQIDFNIFDNFGSISVKHTVDDSNLKKQIKNEFETKISNDIEDRILQKYDAESEVVTEAKVDNNGNVTGISSIKIETNAEPAGLSSMITEIYGVNKDLVMINAG